MTKRNTLSRAALVALLGIAATSIAAQAQHGGYGGGHGYRGGYGYGGGYGVGIGIMRGLMSAPQPEYRGPIEEPERIVTKKKKTKKKIIETDKNKKKKILDAKKTVPARPSVPLQAGPGMVQPASTSSVAVPAATIPAIVTAPALAAPQNVAPQKVVHLEPGPALAKKSVPLGPGPGQNTVAGKSACDTDPNGTQCALDKANASWADSMKELDACTGKPGAADSVECKAIRAANKAKTISNAKGACATAADKFACQVDLYKKHIATCKTFGDKSAECNATLHAVDDAGGLTTAALSAAKKAIRDEAADKMYKACAGSNPKDPSTRSAECIAAISAAKEAGVMSSMAGGGGGAPKTPTAAAPQTPTAAAQPVTPVNNRNVPVVRGPRAVFNGARNVNVVPVAALPDMFIAGNAFQPNGFVALAQPVCGGVTTEGCALRWQNVATDDGGIVTQCVQYCPRAGGTPVAASAAPAAATRACEVAIFAEGNLAGMNSATTEDQLELAALGWEKQIASIQVKDGTWDFYTEAGFAGETMRLAPGTYGNLGDRWTKQVSSFMCVQPPQNDQVAALMRTASINPPTATDARNAVATAPGGRTCEVAIFAEANLSGLNSATTENQPKLDQIGWAREIASIQVRDGGWEFYAEPNYAGESLRLAPGSFGILGDRWAKKIASFKCTQSPR